jgi:Ca2+-binding RTX toxin-like protein
MPAFPSVIVLADLTSAEGFTIQGDDGANAGFSVSSAGDVNADGIDDLIIGAVDYGEAYVVFGTSAGLGTETGGRRVLDTAALTAAQGFIIRSAANDQAGYSVASAGDVNGDGIDDLIVGATGGAGAGGSYAGQAYVVFGSSTGFGVDEAGRRVVDLGTLGADEGFIIQGDAAGDYAGVSVASAGDVNGDGIHDLIVGARGGDDGGENAGEAYVVFGSANGFGTEVAGRKVMDLTDLSSAQGFIIQGDAPGDWAGYSVASAGDVNGDGIDDLVVGANGGDKGGSDAGQAYVVFGTGDGFGSAVGGRQVLDLASLSAAHGFIVQGDDDNDLMGFSVATAGDVNGDGIDDLIVGAYGGSDGGSNAGEAYVVFGTKAGFGAVVGSQRVVDLTTLTEGQGFVIQGDVAFDEVGRSVASAGDINGDGIGDLVIGAPYADDGGKAHVVYGTTGTFGAAVTIGDNTRQVVDLSTLTEAQGFTLLGDAMFDRAGFSVAAAGDINGDGIDDLVVGAPRGDDGGSNAGEAYVVFGRGPISTSPTGGNDDIKGTTGDDNIDALAGNDKVDGAQGNDFLNGGAGDDQLTGGIGNDIYVVDANGDVITEKANEGTDEIRTGLAVYSLAALANIEKLTGTAATGQKLTGNGLANTITGAAGNDRLDGGGAADAMSGGHGNDIYVVGTWSDSPATADDVVIENVSAGTDTVESSVTYVLTAHVENLVLTGSAAINGTGNSEANRITGNAVANTLSGGSNNDTLNGLAGMDSLDGGSGNDRLDGGTGGDAMAGGLGHDVYVADNLDDTVTENGSEGTDTVESSVDFRLPTHVEKLVLTGTAGRTGRGNSGDNNITGNSGANTLNGSGGNDVIDGAAGNDLIYGSAGNDSLKGGTGLDRFLFNSALGSTNVDKILDFSAPNDTISLDRAIFAKAGANGTLSAAAFRQGSAAADASDRIVYEVSTGKMFYDADGAGGAAQVLFATVTPGAALTNADFVIYG